MVKLPAQLTIVGVAEYRIEILKNIDEHDLIELDDSEVERIDSVGVQLILAIVNYISAQNKTLHWQPKSQLVQKSIKQLGINNPLLNQYFNN